MKTCRCPDCGRIGPGAEFTPTQEAERKADAISLIVVTLSWFVILITLGEMLVVVCRGGGAA